MRYSSFGPGEDGYDNNDHEYNSEIPLIDKTICEV